MKDGKMVIKKEKITPQTPENILKCLYAGKSLLLFLIELRIS